jgi:3-hydroxyisobutyrate dehydrogenase-like beta-hydroxyacid dehydrogenase
MTHFNLLVIGFGKAGKTLAKYVASQGFLLFVFIHSDCDISRDCTMAFFATSKNTLCSTTLNNQQYIDSIRGKGGGYRANAHTPTITLDTLYQLALAR